MFSAQQSTASHQPTVDDVAFQAEVAAEALKESTYTSALVALRGAWEALLRWRRETGRVTEPHDEASWSSLRKAMQRELETRLDPPAAERALALADTGIRHPSAPSEEAIDQAAAAFHVHALQAAAREPSRRFTLRSAAVLLTGMLLALLAALAVGLLVGPRGPWYGYYYDNRDFEGEPRVERARKVEFSWGRGSPMRGLGRDDFSVIWQTCLQLGEPTRVKFSITSDDGSRVFVDGDKVVDNWGGHPPRTRAGAKMLAAGSHVVRVEYFEITSGAMIELEAAFGDGNLEPIAPDRLRLPVTGPDPCP